MGKFADDITTFCAPSQVNLLFGVIGFVLAFTSVGIIASFSHLFVTLLWCLVLNYLCSIGWTKLSWFLVLWPFMLLLLGIVVFLVVTAGNDLNYVYQQAGIPGPNQFFVQETPGVTTTPVVVTTTPVVVTTAGR
jgi:hypothetical protein